MHEIVPMVQLSDGFTYIDAQFTKDCINDFRKNYSHLRFHSLKHKILYIQKWSLHLIARDSRKSLNTFQNLQVFAVIDQFRVITYEIPSNAQIAKSIRLFKKEEI